MHRSHTKVEVVQETPSSSSGSGRTRDATLQGGADTQSGPHLDSDFSETARELEVPVHGCKMDGLVAVNVAARTSATASSKSLAHGRCPNKAARWMS